ncbi:MAG: hypothetical protein IJH12_06505 [Clostridia bacterium]|nr:hypothetical protein [Clostridia bacterium]
MKNNWQISLIIAISNHRCSEGIFSNSLIVCLEIGSNFSTKATTLERKDSKDG